MSCLGIWVHSYNSGGMFTSVAAEAAHEDPNVPDPKLHTEERELPVRGFTCQTWYRS